MKRYESMTVAQLTALINKYQEHIDNYPYSHNTISFNKHVAKLKEIRSSKIGGNRG